MKKQLLHIAITLSLFLMLGVAAAAQTTREMTIAIPFDFYVGKTALGAGTYTVYRMSSTTGDGFMLRSADRRTKVIFNTQSIRSAGAPLGGKVEFRRYEDKYFLARVWTDGNNIGRELQQSSLERKLARESTRHLAQKDVKPEVVTVSPQ